jgi:3-hydroxybutyryl-CoA dehydrogenase
VLLADVDEATARTAIEGISKRLGRLVEKGKLTAGQRDEATARLDIATDPASFAPCHLIVEAVVEDLDIKVKVLRSVLGALADDAIIASNTSSLSISRLGESIGQAHRTVGMHFFNPAPLMKLVEVIAGARTDDRRRQRLRDRHELGQGHGPGRGRAGVHRQPRGPAVLPGGLADPRRRPRRR